MVRPVRPARATLIMIIKPKAAVLPDMPNNVLGQQLYHGALALCHLGDAFGNQQQAIGVGNTF